MSIPYRVRKHLRRFAVTLLALCLLLCLALFLWVLWLNRYVVYSQEGAKLDFTVSVQYGDGQLAVAPEPSPTVPIYSKEDTASEPDTPVSTELQQFVGYRVSLESLKSDFAGVREKLLALPSGSTVLLEVKDVSSRVYYTSQVAEISTGFDVTQMDALISELQAAGHYIIAQIPAFQEYNYILENERERVPYGLAKVGGNGALWLDSSGPCYWMDPTKEGTLAYLIQLVTELRGLGFDEVVFSDFRFPNTDKIRFEGDKMEALNDAAAVLVRTCSTDTFCVSFTRETADLTLPEGRTRLYLTGVTAANAASAAESAGLADPQAQVVFVTDLNDTRYEAYSVLRPLQ